MHINCNLKNCKKNAFKIDKLCKNMHFAVIEPYSMVLIKTNIYIIYISIPCKMEIF